ncbi:MAG: hypothetical protein E3J54_04925 [Actinobacteria bacterium]|nr:MAG: hypothetical protein E3J54_04925 [Actinomycetota bacterium]
MEELHVIKRIEKDCREKGHGRKKWWAENLGVHQQTLSYWLHGHRRPRGYRVQQMNNHLSIMNDKAETLIWSGFLRNTYLKSQTVNSGILVSAIKNILSTETVDSRTLAFISYVIENSHICKLYDDYSLLRNRLGWLLEVSGKCPTFKPVKSKTMLLVKAPGSYSNPKVIEYLKQIQTPIGKRWHVYDADISKTKRSFIGRLRTDS